MATAAYYGIIYKKKQPEG